MKDKILVTGGAGYIGSKVSNDLIKLGHKVFIVDNLSTGYKKLIPKKAKFFFCDILNKNKITNIIKKNNIKVVMHFAASLSVEESQKNPTKYYKNNVLGTKKILEAISFCGIKYFVFSSTCSVYGDVKKKVNERQIPRPKSIYAKTKLKSELLIKKYSNKYNFYYSILRYFNVAGADLKNNIGCINSNGQLFKNLCLSIKDKNYKINIYGKDYETKDGTCVRDYIHLNDISKIHYLALKRLKKDKKSFIINCGYGKGYSVSEIVNNFEKYIKKKIHRIFEKRRGGDIAMIISDVSKMKKILNFKPIKKPLKKIIISALNWELKN
jgi:UDP-glucose 4-epimerase